MGNQRIDETRMSILPKRVLDVGKKDEEYIRLVEPSNERGFYCALSHCWGTEKPLMTTVDTLSNHLAGISLIELPKTFREAVEITRGIGIRYLWIDSLCIIQGHKQDWHEQAEHMGMLYAHAYLTIAASDAKDSAEGCFFHVDTKASMVCLPFYSGEGKVTGHFCLSSTGRYGRHIGDPYVGPLSSRAWALQEWRLSRRMLHCTKGGLMWECRHICLDEKNVQQERKKHMDEDWDDLINTYTQSMLTYATDRLVALRGMINAIQQTRSDQNNFGIWSDDMPRGLLWSVESKGMEGMRDLPTWSWAAKDGSKFIWTALSNGPTQEDMNGI
jgi:hypothetical protein